MIEFYTIMHGLRQWAQASRCNTDRVDCLECVRIDVEPLVENRATGESGDGHDAELLDRPLEILGEKYRAWRNGWRQARYKRILGIDLKEGMGFCLGLGSSLKDYEMHCQVVQRLIRWMKVNRIKVLFLPRAFMIKRALQRDSSSIGLEWGQHLPRLGPQEWIRCWVLSW